MEQPDVDRGELYEELKRSQSDWEDWYPNDCDFWTGTVESNGEDDEDSSD